jgi:hypothetical protein
LKGRNVKQVMKREDICGRGRINEEGKGVDVFSIHV